MPHFTGLAIILFLCLIGYIGTMFVTGVSEIFKEDQKAKKEKDK